MNDDDMNAPHIFRDRFIERAIESQQFLFEEGVKRIIGSFSSIESDSEQLSDRKFEEYCALPGTGDECLGTLAETALYDGIDHYLLLEKLRRKAVLSVAMLSFHEWEVTLGSWLNEIEEYIHPRPNVSVHRLNFSQRVHLLESASLPIRASDYYESLDELRLVVNTLKHGSGDSLDKLFLRRPDFFQVFADAPTKDPSMLGIGLDELKRYSEAIVAFWTAMPILWPQH